MSRLPREQQRAILAESEETARLEKVAQIDMGRAFDFANAGRYKEALPILTDVIERLNPECTDGHLEDSAGGKKEGVRFVSKLGILALKSRAQIHVDCGDLQQALDDVSVLVRLAPFLTVVGQHYWLRDFLELRVHILRLMGDYDGAIADAQVWMDLGDNIEEESTRAALTQFQEISVIKLAETAVAETPRRRPYFADEAARRAFQRSAMIGPWARRERGCALCGRKHTSAEPLMWCSRCHQVAYCCRDHQKEDWKEGHKNACNEFQSHRNNPFAALKGTRDDLAAMLRDKGYDLLRHNENPDILLQDPATGEFYELISNTKVLCMGEMSAAEVALLDKSGGTSYVPVAGLVESRRG